MPIMRRLFYFLFGLLISVSTLAQGLISGRITSKTDNKPMYGVSVTVKGSNRTTQTDENGNFSINASQGEILQFSFVGYTTTEVKVGNSASLNVSLASAESEMGEIVVTALGIK